MRSRGERWLYCLPSFLFSKHFNYTKQKTATQSRSAQYLMEKTVGFQKHGLSQNPEICYSENRNNPEHFGENLRRSHADFSFFGGLPFETHGKGGFVKKTDNRQRADVIFKRFWRDNDRFASLFNTVVFGGRKIIKAEDLQELDTDLSNEILFGEYRETLERIRDVVKKAARGMDFLVLGIENQSKIHYAMPLRVMIYDGMGYLKECQEITRLHRKEKDLMTPEEFLSGLRREDRLHPIITIVIYYSEKPWDGPLLASG